MTRLLSGGRVHQLGASLSLSLSLSSFSASSPRALLSHCLTSLLLLGFPLLRKIISKRLPALLLFYLCYVTDKHTQLSPALWGVLVLQYHSSDCVHWIVYILTLVFELLATCDHYVCTLFYYYTGIRLTKWLASRNGQFHIFVNNSFLNTNLGGFVVTI